MRNTLSTVTAVKNVRFTKSRHDNPVVYITDFDATISNTIICMKDELWDLSPELHDMAEDEAKRQVKVMLERRSRLEPISHAKINEQPLQGGNRRFAADLFALGTDNARRALEFAQRIEAEERKQFSQDEEWFKEVLAKLTPIELRLLKLKFTTEK
jgi:hypothetical protein